jgi:hypothetical protein
MKDTKAHNHTAKQPSAVANYTFGPVSGLISGVNLNHHLPMREHSGVLMTLYLYTVAGAASDLVKTLPTSRLTIRFDYLLEPESRAQL